MKNSPALIMATWLQAAGLALNPDEAGVNQWPVYVNQAADQPDNIVYVHDTAGTIDGRLHRTGQTVQHYGIMFSVRAHVSRAARQKLDDIADACDLLKPTVLAVGNNEYRIDAINQQSTAAFGGPDTKTRFTFTLNVLTTIQEIT